MSFPLVGNLSEGEERFWTSQNDRYRISKELLERVS
jgi:hypothetical protein